MGVLSKQFVYGACRDTRVSIPWFLFSDTQQILLYKHFVNHAAEIQHITTHITWVINIKNPSLHSPAQTGQDSSPISWIKSNNQPPSPQFIADDLLPTQFLIAIRWSLLLSKDFNVGAVQHAALLGELVDQFGLFRGERVVDVVDDFFDGRDGVDGRVGEVVAAEL